MKQTMASLDNKLYTIMSRIRHNNGCPQFDEANNIKSIIKLQMLQLLVTNNCMHQWYQKRTERHYLSGDCGNV